MDKENLTRNYIFKAFVQLLQYKTYDKISVCDICTRAGVSRMSFYRNFNSKEDLIFKGLERVTLNVKEKFMKLETKNQFTFIRQIFETIGSFKNVFPSFENCQISKNLMDLAVSKIQTDIPLDFVNKTSKYIPTFYFGALLLVIFQWLKGGTKETPDEMARLMCSLVNTNFVELTAKNCNNKDLEDV